MATSSRFYGAILNSLHEHFSSALMLPKSAADWLCQLYQSIQFFDDVADGDKFERKELDCAIWNLLVSMPQNQFFSENSKSLTPLIATQILKWQASDKSERTGTADAKSFVWRAGYYDIVLFVASLVHGHEAATNASESILRIYGENLGDYLKEFNHA